jgi:hypothetical protein
LFAIVLLAVLLIPGIWLEPDQFNSWVLAAQTFGVLFALAFAVSQLRVAAQQVTIGVEQLRHGAEQVKHGAEQVAQGARTFETDVYDRRVDRIYDLHRELTTGEVDSARRRLTSHINNLSREEITENGSTRQYVRRVSPKDLREGPYSTYPFEPDKNVLNPRRDLGVLLRFFQRARIQQEAGSVDDAVFVELIGRHAAWFNCAVKVDASRTRLNLMEIGTWVDQRAAELAPIHSYLRDWGNSRRKDFGSVTPWVRDSHVGEGTP